MQLSWGSLLEFCRISYLQLDHYNVSTWKSHSVVGLKITLPPAGELSIYLGFKRLDHGDQLQILAREDTAEIQQQTILLRSADHRGCRYA